MSGVVGFIESTGRIGDNRLSIKPNITCVRSSWQEMMLGKKARGSGPWRFWRSEGMRPVNLGLLRVCIVAQNSSAHCRH
jgi:hypothetical protein